MDAVSNRPWGAPARRRRAGSLTIVLSLLAGCAVSGSAAAQTDAYQSLRDQMVEKQIRKRGVDASNVLEAMRAVPRHEFMPPYTRELAYSDQPVRIGSGQTISQPYIVGLMTSLLELDGSEKVLEIGTGSGYQAAVLSQVAKEVYSIEILDELGSSARSKLEELGYDNVHVKIADGYRGWPDEAPFDAIMVTAAPPRIPGPLIDQLKVGGRMVVPVGAYFQELWVITKEADGYTTRKDIPVRFVPMVGEIEKQPE